MNTEYVEIFLPTYNGEKYLCELMDSLVSQTYKKFVLVTYDDGSVDKSVEIVDSYKDRLEIIRIPNELNENRGALGSFVYLLSKASAESIMPCDQDDVWKSNKVYECKKKLDEQREKYGEIPLLVFSDLEMTDEFGNVTVDSFLEYYRFNLFYLNDIYYLCFKNPAPGCSMIFNKELVKCSLPLGDQAIMHDWWLILNACLNGKIAFIEEPLIKYRIHANNTMGMDKENPRSPILSVLSVFSSERRKCFKGCHGPVIKQAKQLFLSNGKKFFVAKYYLKFSIHRYFFLFLGRINAKFMKKAW